MGNRKVALIAQQGSGTNLLRALLNSHPDISFHGELFIRSNAEADGRWEHSRISQTEYLEDFFSGETGTVGFDVKYNQLSDEIIAYMVKNGVGVLHLLRDPARTALKSVKRSGQGLSYDDLREHVDYVLHKRNLVRERFEGMPYKEITYEEITLGRQLLVGQSVGWLNDLQVWLGVAPEFLSIDNPGLVVRFDE